MIFKLIPAHPTYYCQIKISVFYTKNNTGFLSSLKFLMAQKTLLKAGFFINIKLEELSNSFRYQSADFYVYTAIRCNTFDQSSTFLSS